MANEKLPPRLAEKYMLLADAMEETGLSRTSIDEKRRAGIFSARRWKRYVLIPRSEVDRFLDNLPVA